MVKPTLLVLAAGMGSRYGSLKQMDGVGPNGEAIIDYSIYDAIRAGFGKVVFVIRQSFADDFKKVFTPEKFGGKIEVDFVYQELDKLPEGFSLPEGREKPWGTNHAVMMAAEAIKEPFAVINADDFYGQSAYATIAKYLVKVAGIQNHYCMVGYKLQNTISDHGSVSRGVCEVDSEGDLVSMVERTRIEKRGDSIVFIEGDVETPLSGSVPVSMNLFGFTSDYFIHSEEYFKQFLKDNISNLKAEFFIPLMVNKLVNDETVKLRVLETDAQWFGVTYKEDRPKVVESIRALIESGAYPEKIVEMKKIEKEIWGKSPNGEEILLYTITNAKSASVQLTNIGASIVSVVVPDRDGQLADVVLGYGEPLNYFHDAPYHGTTTGRYANRIAKGSFELDGRRYDLDTNNGSNHLHGGLDGFDSRVWKACAEDNSVIFTLESPDGDQGYPGELVVGVRYVWGDDSVLTIEYRATTDAPTVVNLTNHAYFNLAGEGSGSVLRHTLKLNSDKFLVTDSTLIPTGEIRAVEGTPMDFRVAKELGADVDVVFEPLTFGAGYDHCFVVNDWVEGRMADVAELCDPMSGRVLRVSSSQPAVQIYSGNWLAGAARGKNGRPYENREGVAIECQGFPDAPNRPQFPSQRLNPGERYKQTIVYTFGVE